MQNRLSRFSRWWLSQFSSQGCLGKSVFLGFTIGVVFFACMFGFALLSVVASPFLPDPTATVQQVNVGDAIESAAAENNRSNTIAVVETAPSIATISILPTLTDLPTIPPTSIPATATVKPSPIASPVHAATVVMLTVEASEISMQTPTEIPPTSTAIILPTSTQQVAPTAVPPTALPPTALPTVPPPTAIPPTTVPTVAQPTATLPTATGSLIIIGVNKGDEYVDIRNDGGAAVDLSGWTLRSEKGSQDCRLGGVIGPGQVLRIWAMSKNADQGGFNCGFGSDIWNNSDPDPAVLINPSGQEVSRR